MNKLFSLATASVYFLSSVVLVHANESFFWEQRRNAAQPKPANESQLYAGLPSNLAVIPTAIKTWNPNLNATRVPDVRLSDNAKAILSAIPSGAAAIKKIETPSNFDERKPLVILIQDVHMNVEAQKNIAAAILAVNARALDLGKDDTSLLVGVEGAFTDFNFAKLRAAAPTVTAALADDFLAKYWMAAPSYAGITAPRLAGRFVGVDDPIHYRKNVEAYLASRSQAEHAIANLKTERVKLEAEKSALYNTELKRLDALISEHQSSRIGFGDYVAHLEKLAGAQNPDLVVEQFLSAYEIEKALDFRRVENERNKVVEALAKKLSKTDIDQLVAASLQYRSGAAEFSSYYRFVRRLIDKYGLALSNTPAFEKYLTYALLSDGIDAEKLFKAVGAMETAAIESLCRTAEERALMKASRAQWLREKLVRFELTPDEWDAYRATAGRDALKPFENFYLEADIRSEKMAANLLSSSEKDRINGAVVLVAGGFHSPFLTRRLKENGAPVAQVQPRITKVDDLDGSAYLSAFAQTLPIDQLFKGEKLFLANVNQAMGGAAAAAGRDMAFRISAAAVAVAAGEKPQPELEVEGVNPYTISDSENPGQAVVATVSDSKNTGTNDDGVVINAGDKTVTLRPARGVKRLLKYALDAITEVLWAAAPPLLYMKHDSQTRADKIARLIGVTFIGLAQWGMTAFLIFAGTGTLEALAWGFEMNVTAHLFYNLLAHLFNFAPLSMRAWADRSIVEGDESLINALTTSAETHPLHNEDAVAVIEKDGVILEVLSDGMGGVDGGKESSKAVLDAVIKSVRPQLGLLKSLAKTTPADEITATLDHETGAIFQLAAKAAHDAVQQLHIQEGGGATLVITLSIPLLDRNGNPSGETYARAYNSGDSMIYYFNKNSGLVPWSVNNLTSYSSIADPNFRRHLSGFRAKEIYFSGLLSRTTSFETDFSEAGKDPATENAIFMQHLYSQFPDIAKAAFEAARVRFANGDFATYFKNNADFEEDVLAKRIKLSINPAMPVALGVSDTNGFYMKHISLKHPEFAEEWLAKIIPLTFGIVSMLLTQAKNFEDANNLDIGAAYYERNYVAGAIRKGDKRANQGIASKSLIIKEGAIFVASDGISDPVEIGRIESAIDESLSLQEAVFSVMVTSTRRNRQWINSRGKFDDKALGGSNLGFFKINRNRLQTRAERRLARARTELQTRGNNISGRYYGWLDAAFSVQNNSQTPSVFTADQVTNLLDPLSDIFPQATEFATIRDRLLVHPETNHLFKPNGTENRFEAIEKLFSHWQNHFGFADLPGSNEILAELKQEFEKKFGVPYDIKLNGATAANVDKIATFLELLSNPDKYAEGNLIKRGASIDLDKIATIHDLLRAVLDLDGAKLISEKDPSLTLPTIKELTGQLRRFLKPNLTVKGILNDVGAQNVFDENAELNVGEIFVGWLMIERVLLLGSKPEWGNAARVRDELQNLLLKKFLEYRYMIKDGDDYRVVIVAPSGTKLVYGERLKTKKISQIFWRAFEASKIAAGQYLPNKAEVTDIDYSAVAPAQIAPPVPVKPSIPVSGPAKPAIPISAPAPLFTSQPNSAPASAKRNGTTASNATTPPQNQYSQIAGTREKIIAPALLNGPLLMDPPIMDIAVLDEKTYIRIGELYRQTYDSSLPEIDRESGKKKLLELLEEKKLLQKSYSSGYEAPENWPGFYYEPVQGSDDQAIDVAVGIAIKAYENLLVLQKAEITVLEKRVAGEPNESQVRLFITNAEYFLNEDIRDLLINVADPKRADYLKAIEDLQILRGWKTPPAPPAADNIFDPSYRLQEINLRSAGAQEQLDDLVNRYGRLMGIYFPSRLPDQNRDISDYRGNGDLEPIREIIGVLNSILNPNLASSLRISRTRLQDYRAQLLQLHEKLAHYNAQHASFAGQLIFTLALPILYILFSIFYNPFDIESTIGASIAGITTLTSLLLTARLPRGAIASTRDGQTTYFEAYYQTLSERPVARLYVDIEERLHRFTTYPALSPLNFDSTLFAPFKWADEFAVKLISLLILPFAATVKFIAPFAIRSEFATITPPLTTTESALLSRTKQNARKDLLLDLLPVFNRGVSQWKANLRQDLYDSRFDRAIELAGGRIKIVSTLPALVNKAGRKNITVDILNEGVTSLESLGRNDGGVRLIYLLKGQISDAALDAHLAKNPNTVLVEIQSRSETALLNRDDMTALLKERGIIGEQDTLGRVRFEVGNRAPITRQAIGDLRGFEKADENAMDLYLYRASGGSREYIKMDVDGLSRLFEFERRVINLINSQA